MFLSYCIIFQILKILANRVKSVISHDFALIFSISILFCTFKKQISHFLLGSPITSYCANLHNTYCKKNLFCDEAKSFCQFVFCKAIKRGKQFSGLSNNNENMQKAKKKCLTLPQIINSVLAKLSTFSQMVSNKSGAFSTNYKMPVSLTAITKSSTIICSNN